MPREKPPVFRRAIIPWYDADRVCWIVVGFMLSTAVFSTAGLFAALEETDYQRHIWLPMLLLLLSIGITISTLIRMFRRYIERISR